MTAAADTPAALLADLATRGVGLQAHGDRLRFRPQSALTAELVARLKAHKPVLVAMLSVAPVTRTHESYLESRGFGDSDAGDEKEINNRDRLALSSYAPAEAALLADAPADVSAAVEAVKRAFPGAELVRVECTAPEPPSIDAAAWPSPDAVGRFPENVADLARERDGWTPVTWRGRLLSLAATCNENCPDRATELRRAAITLVPGLVEAFEERAAIMEFDAGLSRGDAEAAAAADTLALLKGAK